MTEVSPQGVLAYHRIAMAGARSVVWISHRDGERCVACGAETPRGTLVVLKREAGLRCLACAGLADLEYVPAGDVALTRRALTLSSRVAIVVKFSRARKRHERQGVLVEPEALAAARASCEEDAARRQAARGPRQARAERKEQAYFTRLLARIVELFPGCPGEEPEAIARRACEKHSGRVGRSRAAKLLDEAAEGLEAFREEVIIAGVMVADEARPLVAGAIEDHLARWREVPEAGSRA